MESNDKLVDYLVEKEYIQSERVEQAFRNVDRARFVTKEEYAYIDRPYPLEEGATVSAPHIVAQMLELLEPEGKVLEMGSGSGYVLALLTELADEVVGVERIENLVHESQGKVPEARVILADSMPEEQFNRVLYSFATKNIEEEAKKAQITVAPIIEENEQFLKKFKEGKVENIVRVRFVEERKGLKK